MKNHFDNYNSSLTEQMAYLIVLYSDNKVPPIVYGIANDEDEVNDFIEEKKIKCMIPGYRTSDKNEVIKELSECGYDEEYIEDAISGECEYLRMDDSDYVPFNKYEITDISLFEDKEDFMVTWHLDNARDETCVAIFEMFDYNVRDIIKKCDGWHGF